VYSTTPRFPERQGSGPKFSAGEGEFIPGCGPARNICGRTQTFIPNHSAGFELRPGASAGAGGSNMMFPPTPTAPGHRPQPHRCRSAPTERRTDTGRRTSMSFGAVTGTGLSRLVQGEKTTSCAQLAARLGVWHPPDGCSTSTSTTALDSRALSRVAFGSPCVIPSRQTKIHYVPGDGT